MDNFDTPILFITFKRPDTTIKVFEMIRIAKPKKLFLVQNYPSGKNASETENWKEVRSIIESVDWDCDVQKLYRSEHLGVKISVSSAIDWFFSNVEEGIILEDDCVPDQSFFPFCQELLAKYRNDERIMMISGDNFQSGRKRTEDSYYFSHCVHIWGWASWRRAWSHYDVNMRLWPKIETEGWLKDILQNKKAEEYWYKIFSDVYSDKVNTWDYQWVFTCWLQNALSIIPNKNLISNIGYGPSATHPSTDLTNSNLSRTEIEFPLVHPEFIIRNALADSYTQKEHYICNSSNPFIKLKAILARLR